MYFRVKKPLAKDKRGNADTRKSRLFSTIEAAFLCLLSPRKNRATSQKPSEKAGDCCKCTDFCVPLPTNAGEEGAAKVIQYNVTKRHLGAQSAPTAQTARFNRPYFVIEQPPRPETTRSTRTTRLPRRLPPRPTAPWRCKCPVWRCKSPKIIKSGGVNPSAPTLFDTAHN